MAILEGGNEDLPILIVQSDRNPDIPSNHVRLLQKNRIGEQTDLVFFSSYPLDYGFLQLLWKTNTGAILLFFNI